MYYVLFTYSKGRKERDFRRFRSEQGLIDFLHEKYEKIEIVQIIEAEKSFRLGLIETEDFVRSELISQDLKVELSGHGDPLPPIEEKSGMEKIADGIEEEMKEEETEEEVMRKNKAALARANSAIAAAKEDLEKNKKPETVSNPVKKRAYMKKEVDKSNWPVCPECSKEKMAPWNTSGRCSTCQRYKKK